jgi:hypothetical protein
MNPPLPRPQLFGLLAGLFLAAALCFASVTVTRTWVHLKESQLIQVTGSARKNVRSDLCVWNGVLQTEGKTLEEARAKFEKDQRRLVEFLTAKGFPRHTLSPVHVRDITPRGKGGAEADEGEVPQRVGYQLLQGVQISSERVEDLPNLAAECLTLLADGVVVQTSGIQYIYTKLPEARLTMMGEATDDARRRAEEIAGRGGRAVRELRTARMGVVQVNPLHGTSTSWEGNNDQSTLEKTISATVSAEFSLR